MKNDRLFGIVHYLSDRKSTVGELAARFGVSKRTILRDINTLSLAGVPVCTASGNGGGVSLLDGYVLDKAVLSESEREQIACGLKIFAQFGSEKSVTNKLAAVFSRVDTDWIDVDLSGWGATVDNIKFTELKRAVTSCADGETERRRAYPLRLVYKSKAWYVRAYCLLRNAYRTFKINRMSGITVLGSTFDPREYSLPPMGGEWTDCPVIDISAKFSRSAAYRVFDEFYAHEITKNADGTLAVATSMPLNEYVYGYLMSFGDSLLSLEPKSLRDEIAKRCKIMSENFSNVT